MNEAILERLDKLTEQLELANALRMAAVMPDMKLRLSYEWKDMDVKNSGGEAPESGKRQRLIPLAVCRIAPDE